MARSASRIKLRLQAAGFGAGFVFLGMLQLSRGGRIRWIDWRHLPVLSGAEMIATQESRSLINLLLAHYRHGARIGRPISMALPSVVHFAAYWSLPLASTRQVCSTASPRIPYTHSWRFMATQM
jgi:hypothetical protein